MSTTKLIGGENWTKYAFWLGSVRPTDKENQVKMYKKYYFRYITSLKWKGPDTYQIEKQDPDPYQIEKQDPDPYQSEKQEPDPYQSEKQDPNPYQKGLDSQHWAR